MAGRKPRQPPPGNLPAGTGRPAPSDGGTGPAAPAGGSRSAANSAKVQLLPTEGAQIHELWPGAGSGGTRNGRQDVQASRDWEAGPASSGRPRAGGNTPEPDRTGTEPTDAGRTAGDRKPGTEASILAFPEPPVRRRRRYIVGGTSVAAVLLAALFAVLFFSPALELKTVEIQGNTLLTTEAAESALSPLLGTPLTLISDADAGALLADRPEVEKVEVAAMPPSGLMVTITERVPVAVLQNGREFVLIDEDGRQLMAVGERGSVALPLIDGGTEAVNSEVFSTVTAVLAALPQNVLAQLDHASADTVDSVELKLANGQSVFWGSAEANAPKARALEALLLVPPTDPPVQVFDVSTPDRPVTR